MHLPLYFSWCKRLENRDLYRRHLEAYNKAFNVFLDSSIFFSVSITEIAIMATSNDAYSRIIGIQLIMPELIPGLCLCTIRDDRFVMHLVLQVVVWILSFITVGVAIFYNVSLHSTECFGSGLQFAPNIWVLMANLGVFTLIHHFHSGRRISRLYAVPVAIPWHFEHGTHVGLVCIISRIPGNLRAPREAPWTLRLPGDSARLSLCFFGLPF